MTHNVTVMLSENESNAINKKYHVPADKLIRYMREKSSLDARKDDLEGLKMRGEITHKDEQDLERIKSRGNTLKNTKTEILDEIIFPSMANLVFFFESIAEDKVLNALFQSDVFDLLGINRLNPRDHENKYGFMFKRLVYSMIVTSSREDDYKLKLVDILQELINYKIGGFISLNVKNLLFWSFKI